MSDKTPKKRGPKPKTLVPVEKLGIPVSRKKVVIPPDEVFKLAALGCTGVEIATYFGVPYDAINRNFAEELKKGREEQKVKLRRAMMHNACSNYNAAVQIFLAKNLLGMSDNGPTNSEDNQPLPWSDEDED